jgi:hypothetical protein
MELIIPKVVWLLPISEPGELEPVAGFSIAEKDEDETAVGGLFSPDFSKLERFLVETEALLQVQDIEIVVGKKEFHLMFLL